MSLPFHVINLGCKVNKVESDAFAAHLLAAGAQQASLDEAELVLINTCTVTGEADAKSRKAVSRATQAAKKPRLIVCGCAAVVNGEQFALRNSRVKVIPDKAQALAEALALLESAKQAPVPASSTIELSSPASSAVIPKPPASSAAKPSTVGASSAVKPEPPAAAKLELPASSAVRLGPLAAASPLRVGSQFATRVALKAQDGCDNHCSYCIVPRARGAARSVSSAQLCAEAAQLIQAGTRELVLTGIDLGCYRDGALKLPQLLLQLLALGTGHRLRLSSLELPSLSDELVTLMAACSGRICAHLHVPLQSGSERILKAMLRRYTAEDYLGRVAELRSALPHLALTTDIMVGFPGETEEDFESTLAVARQAGFSRVHVFRYSSRKGTLAAELPQQIAATVKAERAQRLRNLAECLARKDAEARIGTTEAVLIERPGRGRTESYHPVVVSAHAKRGSLVTMQITGFEGTMLKARSLKPVAEKRRFGAGAG